MSSLLWIDLNNAGVIGNLLIVGDPFSLFMPLNTDVRYQLSCKGLDVPDSRWIILTIFRYAEMLVGFTVLARKATYLAKTSRVAGTGVYPK